MTLWRPGLAQRENSFPTRGAGRPGSQAIRPPGVEYLLTHRLLTDRTAAPASGACYVSERRSLSLLSWPRLCLSASQSPRGHSVAWPIRVSLAPGPRSCQSKRHLGSRLSRKAPPTPRKPSAFCCARGYGPISDGYAPSRASRQSGRVSSGGSPLEAPPLRPLCHVTAEGAGPSCEPYHVTWERLCAAAAILREGGGVFFFHSLCRRYRGSQRPPSSEPSPAHKTFPVAL